MTFDNRAAPGYDSRVTDAPALDAVRFDAAGLVPVVTQDARNGNLLMLAWADRAALEATLATGHAHYWSRSRQALWKKGEQSGHLQQVAEVRLDCDADAVLYRVTQTGPACHTNRPTCFFRRITPEGQLVDGDDEGGHLLTRLARMIADRQATLPPESYTATLFERGLPKIAQKVGEEGVETVIAALAESEERLASEAADLLFHLLVLLQARGVAFETVLAELSLRVR
jgi:phosphoribosyl-ATP pyrophosphohydrolase/phosphoribosyl-AMP cyclohydrolase